jgi:hypothetical protein
VPGGSIFGRAAGLGDANLQGDLPVLRATFEINCGEYNSHSLKPHNMLFINILHNFILAWIAGK